MFLAAVPSSQLSLARVETMTTKHEKPHSVDLENKLGDDVDNVSLEAGSQSLPSKNWLTRLRNALSSCAETRGVAPVPIEERSDKDTLKLFTLWLTANCTTLPYVSKCLPE